MNSGRSFSTPVLFLALGLVAGSSIGVAYANGIITFDGDFLLNGDFFCDGCIDTAEIATGAVGSSEIAANAVGASEIAANAVGGSEIIGTSKLLFRECSVTFTNVASMDFQVSTCQLPGLASGDNVIITDTDTIPNCMIFGGLSSSLDNLLQIQAYNGCPNTVTQTVDYSVIIFRVN